ncbi:MAG: hypothetical protein IJ060_11935 [Oscillospiraceae bacterium]|nr:hypothetical protein [Oscillospiraceae bacterium]
MGFRTDEFSALTNLQYDPKAKTFWGTVQGYPVFVHYSRRQNALLMNLTGKYPGEQAPPALPQQLDALRERNPLIVGIRRQDRRLIAHLMIPAKAPEPSLRDTVCAVADLARGQGMLPCCAICGREQGYAPYLIHTDGYPICGDCKERVEQDLEADNQKRSQQRGTLSGLVLGAVIGAILVFGTTWIAAGHSRISILTAVGGVMLGMMLMKKLGKKVTVPAAVLCGVLCLIASCAALYLHTAREIAALNRKNHDLASWALTLTEMPPDDQDKFRIIEEHQTTGECLRDFPALIKNEMYTPVREDFKDGLFWGFLSVAAGTAVSAYPYLTESRRRFTLREPVAS